MNVHGRGRGARGGVRPGDAARASRRGRPERLVNRVLNHCNAIGARLPPMIGTPFPQISLFPNEPTVPPLTNTPVPLPLMVERASTRSAGGLAALTPVPLCVMVESRTVAYASPLPGLDCDMMPTLTLLATTLSTMVASITTAVVVTLTPCTKIP